MTGLMNSVLIFSMSGLVFLFSVSPKGSNPRLGV